MKKLNFTIIFALIATMLTAQNTNVDYLIKNVSIIPMTNDKVLSGQSIAINEGKIVDIFDTKSKDISAKKTIDGNGKYVMPSLSDAHVHLPSDSTELSNMILLDLMNGVTKIRSMRGKWDHPEILKAYEASHDITPDFYLSAPPIHRKFDLNVDQLMKYVAGAKDADFDFIKILSVRDDTLFTSLDSLCKIAGLPIAGHFPSNISDSMIFHSQMNDLEHLGGLIGVSDQLKEERINSIKENNIFICPTLSWYVVGYGQMSVQEMMYQPGMEFINPEVVKKWREGTQKYRAKMGTEGFNHERDSCAIEMEQRYAVLKEMNDKGIKLLLSPDASSKFVVPGFGILEEMKLYQKAGLSNYDILRAATVNYALYTNDKESGTIEKGKNADFIMLEYNPLQNINTLEAIQGLFFKNKFLDRDALQNLGKEIKFD